jgi:hypothetical protein
MRYLVIAMLSIAATSINASFGKAQDGQDAIHAPSRTMTPAARVSQSHQDFAKGARAKKSATGRNTGIVEGQRKDTEHVITLEEEKAIPYRACINARGWKNGRLICADDGEKVQLQKGREIEGPFSPR